MRMDAVRDDSVRDLALARARYAWPEHDEPMVEWYGEDGPAIAVALLPHANEPLGYAIREPLAALSALPVLSEGHVGRVALVGPVDPPPPEGRFPLPCDLLAFLRRGHLQPLADQVEFAHCPAPRTRAQRRAASVRELLRGLDAAAVVLVHNDPFARVPYLYANRPWPEVERRLVTADPVAFPDPGLAVDEVEWTSRLAPRTYAYFPATQLDLHGSECAGLYLPGELGIPVLTTELPMFDWTAFTDADRIAAREVMERWIEDGCGPRTELLAQTARLLGRRPVPMISAPVNARVLAAVLGGVRQELALVAARPA
jgi:hypothetical protein